MNRRNNNVTEAITEALFHGKNPGNEDKEEEERKHQLERIGKMLNVRQLTLQRFSGIN